MRDPHALPRAVAAELNSRGYNVTYEYPGFLCLQLPDDPQYYAAAFGQSGWSGGNYEVQTPDGTIDSSGDAFDLNVADDETDPVVIANAVQERFPR